MVDAEADPAAMISDAAAAIPRIRDVMMSFPVSNVPLAAGTTWAARSVRPRPSTE
jgi:hypothetical protein